MAEVFTLFSSDSTGFSSGSPSSAIFNTTGKKNFSLFVVIPPLGTSGSDTIDLTLQECDTDAFTTNEVFTVRITTPAGSGGTAITQATGALTAGNAALLQKFNLQDSNFSQYIRGNLTLGGTPANVKNVRIFLTYDLIKRTTV